MSQEDWKISKKVETKSSASILLSVFTKALVFFNQLYVELAMLFFFFYYIVLGIFTLLQNNFDQM